MCVPTDVLYHHRYDDEMFFFTLWYILGFRHYTQRLPRRNIVAHGRTGQSLKEREKGRSLDPIKKSFLLFLPSPSRTVYFLHNCSLI